jgi:hypothetical protein
MIDEEDYDVVVDTLQKQRAILWNMTNLNLNSEFGGMGIMDQIRLKQIDELDKAIIMWKKRNEQAN